MRKGETCKGDLQAGICPSATLSKSTVVCYCTKGTVQQQMHLCLFRGIYEFKVHKESYTRFLSYCVFLSFDSDSVLRSYDNPNGRLADLVIKLCLQC